MLLKCGVRKPRLSLPAASRDRRDILVPLIFFAAYFVPSSLGRLSHYCGKPLLGLILPKSVRQDA